MGVRPRSPGAIIPLSERAWLYAKTILALPVKAFIGRHANQRRGLIMDIIVTRRENKFRREWLTPMQPT
jgi:hypothetical protein